MTLTELTLSNGDEASTEGISLACLTPMIYPDGRVAVSVDVGAESGDGREYLVHPGETFPVHDQTWKLDRVDNAGTGDWLVRLVRVG
jgi:hypothetical protein